MKTIGQATAMSVLLMRATGATGAIDRFRVGSFGGI